jgi:type VI secretion system protein ImpH
MADDGRLASYALKHAPVLGPSQDLFQLLRRVEAGALNAPRIGRARRLAQDIVRLGQAASLAFAPGAVASVPSSEYPVRVQVHCFGMLGSNGAMPLHFTEYVWQRVKHHGDRSLASFLDLFQHRMLSFFYRAWADANPAVQHDRPELDRFAAQLSSLFGLGTPALRGADALPDSAKRYYAGRLVDQVRNAEGLVALLADHFELPARIEEFVGEWADIPGHYVWRLGDSGNAGSLGFLGQSTTLGKSVWLRQERFRIVLGPLTRPQFERVAPGGPGLPALMALVRGYAGDALRWDLRLELRDDAQTTMQLGAAVLGQTAWLWSAGGSVHQDDLIFEPGHAGDAPRSG